MVKTLDTAVEAGGSFLFVGGGGGGGMVLTVAVPGPGWLPSSTLSLVLLGPLLTLTLTTSPLRRFRGSWLFGPLTVLGNVDSSSFSSGFFWLDRTFSKMLSILWFLVTGSTGFFLLGRRRSKMLSMLFLDD